MAFTEFTEYRKKKTYAERGVFGVRKCGAIYFPERLLNSFVIKQPYFVAVHIDEEARKIGFRFYRLESAKIPCSAKKLYSEASGFSCNISPVLRKLGIEEGKAFELKVEKDEDSGMLVAGF